MKSFSFRQSVNGFKLIPKKSLGQNFLHDKGAIKKIIKAADLKPEDRVLEIGPGTGLLSTQLVKHAGRVIMIEKDDRLANMVADNFQFQLLNFQLTAGLTYNLKNNQGVVSGDVLKINIPKLIEKNNFFDYKLVANIPYYITGKLLRLFLETKHAPKLMVLLLQKEVSERICAKPGRMNILAVSVQRYAKPEIVSLVSRQSFNPIPSVDSAIVRIVPKRNIQELQKENRIFFRPVKAGFSAPRKTLANNLSASFGLEKIEIQVILKKVGLEKNARAQELSIEQWERIAAYLT